MTNFGTKQLGSEKSSRRKARSSLLLWDFLSLVISHEIGEIKIFVQLRKLASDFSSSPPSETRIHSSKQGHLIGLLNSGFSAQGREKSQCPKSVWCRKDRWREIVIGAKQSHFHNPKNGAYGSIIYCQVREHLDSFHFPELEWNWSSAPCWSDDKIYNWLPRHKEWDSIVTWSR